MATSPMSDDSGDTIDIQAGTNIRVVFGVMIGLPLLVLVIEYFRGVRGSGTAVLLLLGIALLTIAWIRGYRLTLSKDQLEYRSLFGGRHSVALNEIEESYEEFNKRDRRGGLGPTHRIVVVPRAESRKREFLINVRAFDSVQMKRVFERLGTRPMEFD